MTQVFLDTIDISDFVTTVPALTLNIGEIGQLITNDLPTLEGLNISGFWDPRNPVSPFFGVPDLSVFPIVVKQDDVIVFTGAIQRITADNQARTASVSIRSVLQTALEHGVIYVSDSATETPASAASAIASLYKIPVDSASFGVSEGIYQLNKVYVNVLLNRPEMTALDVFQALADIGVASIYSFAGVLYFDVFQVKTSASIFTFTDDPSGLDGATLWTNPTIEPVEREKINGYSIQTMQGLASYGDTSQQAKTLDGGPESSVRIMSLQAGNWIGLRWIEYLNQSQERISFGGPAQIGRALPLGAPVAINYTRANWPTTVVDLVSVDNTDRLMSQLIGLTR